MSAIIEQYLSDLDAADNPVQVPIVRYPEGMRGKRAAASIQNLKKARKQLRRDRRRAERQQQRTHPTPKPIRQQAKFTDLSGHIVVIAPRVQRENP